MGVKERHGADALGFVSSSRCTGEENYLDAEAVPGGVRDEQRHQCAAT